MSATFVPEDKEWIKTIFKQNKFSDYELTILESVFDEQTDYDVDKIQKQLEKEKFLRKVCLCKLIVFPLEYITILFILGLQKAKDHFKLAKLYFNFFFKRITFPAFQKILSEEVKSI